MKPLGAVLLAAGLLGTAALGEQPPRPEEPSRTCFFQMLDSMDRDFCRGDLEVIYPEVGDVGCMYVPKCHQYRRRISREWGSPRVRYPQAKKGADLRTGDIKGRVLTGLPGLSPQSCSPAGHPQPALVSPGMSLSWGQPALSGDGALTPPGQLRAPRLGSCALLGWVKGTHAARGAARGMYPPAPRTSAATWGNDAAPPAPGNPPLPPQEHRPPPNLGAGGLQNHPPGARPAITSGPRPRPAAGTTATSSACTSSRPRWPSPSAPRSGSRWVPGRWRAS
ncbi:phosphatidylethanolamine-binding protein 4 isoform X2 [Rissa tridactyla]|uniref:phosphatidylethanolamine-binding protein 4 isoform X2 n=1 Tax=Rissa tridactyla TaxID=75485 RepID=UPI0023BAED2D|nr:phosphatidylethanolamine-binding protein 4 isoform X2 [Rissa tridactyla]